MAQRISTVLMANFLHLINSLICFDQWWKSPSVQHLQQRSHHFQNWRCSQKLGSSLQKATSNISKVLVAFSPQWNVTLIQTSCSFKSVIFYIWQNHKWKHHTLELRKTKLTYHMHYILIPCKKWMSRLYLHLAAQIHASSSSVISWLVCKLFDCTMHILCSTHHTYLQVILGTCYGQVSPHISYAF